MRPVSAPPAPARATGPTPTCPATATRLRRRAATSSTLDYRVASNRLDGRAEHRASRARELPTVHPRPLRTARSARCRSTATGRARSRTAAGKLRDRSSPQPVPAGQPFAVDVRYAGQPAADAQHLGRGRLGGADRRRDRGRPAQRRAVLVPVQRPARRQGDATGSRSPRESPYGWSPTAAARRPAVARRAARPGCTSSRSRWRPTWRPCRSAGTTVAAAHDAGPGARMRRAARPGDAFAQHDFAPAAGDDDALRRSCSGRTRSTATRSSSPTTTSRSRSRRRACRSSAPTTSTGSAAVERLVAHELAHQWFGNSLTARPVARHLAARGLRLLRRVAVVGARPAARRADDWRARHHQRLPRLAAGPGARPTRAGADVRRPALQARRADPARAAPVLGDAPSSRCSGLGVDPPVFHGDDGDFVQHATAASSAPNRDLVASLLGYWLQRPALPDLPVRAG